LDRTLSDAKVSRLGGHVLYKKETAEEDFKRVETCTAWDVEFI